MKSKKEEFIKEYSPDFTISDLINETYDQFEKDLDQLINSEIGYYLQEQLNNSDVGSLEYRIIDTLLEEL